MADLDPTPSNLNTSILGGLGTLTEGAGKQGSDKLVMEEQIAPQESSRSKRDLSELARRMREEAGTRVDEKEEGHVKQTVEVLQSPAIYQVSFFILIINLIIKMPSQQYLEVRPVPINVSSISLPYLGEELREARDRLVRLHDESKVGS